MMLVLLADPTRKPILLTDKNTASRLPQPFENHYMAVLILDKKGVEIRMFESLKKDNTKYAIHTERINAETPIPNMDEDSFAELEKTFINSFMAIWRTDKLDYRKAARFALKSICPSP